MNKTILFSFLITAVGTSFAQDASHQRVKAELVEWDAVRGEWLAESFNAMSNNQPIPDRTFPEELTPAEMYSLVPADRQERIRGIVSQQNNVQNPRENRAPETTQSGTTRVPVGGSNPSTRPSDNGNRYNYYVTRPGCGLTMARSYGDPHIRTFDGKSFSFQTAGEYVLSSSPDRTFEVQARQRPQTNDVSLNTAVAMNVYGDRVGIYASDAPDGQSGTSVRVNGQSVYINNETFYLPHGGTIQNTGQEYVVTWPTGEKVQVKLSRTSGMNFMNLSVYVYECNGNYYGLMGNANGRSDDDFSGSNRSDLASSTIFDPFGSRDFGRSTTAIEREHLAFIANDFGNQFRVNDQTSLFDYGFGQSSWTFYDPSFPRTHLTLGDISQADRDRARRECERQGILADEMSGCVMDFAHANIEPTPRPTAPNRTTGRDLNPVSDRKPNVNRPDVFERVPGQGTSGRTPEPVPNNPGTRVNEGVEEPVRQGGGTKPTTTSSSGTEGTISRDKQPESGTGTTRQPVSDTDRSSKPATTSKPATSSGSTTTTRTADKPVSKPVPEPAPKPQSNERTAPKPQNTGSGTTRPVSNPTPKPQSEVKDRPTTKSSPAPTPAPKPEGGSTKTGSTSPSRSGR